MQPSCVDVCATTTHRGRQSGLASAAVDRPTTPQSCARSPPRPAGPNGLVSNDTGEMALTPVLGFYCREGTPQHPPVASSTQTRFRARLSPASCRERHRRCWRVALSRPCSVRARRARRVILPRMHHSRGALPGRLPMARPRAPSSSARRCLAPPRHGSRHRSTGLPADRLRRVRSLISSLRASSTSACQTSAASVSPRRAKPRPTPSLSP
jgi:hypothetical protein